jgi:hypothetical protein
LGSQVEALVVLLEVILIMSFVKSMYSTSQLGHTSCRHSYTEEKSSICMFEFPPAYEYQKYVENRTSNFTMMMMMM